MALYFPPPERQPSQEERTAAQPPPALSEALLERHGARVLRASEAVTRPGARAPETTVYRHGTLLVPEDLLQQGAAGQLNEILQPLGLAVVPPTRLTEIVGYDIGADSPLYRLPRSVALRRTEGAGRVDSWDALQAVRAAAERGPHRLPGFERIGLEHLLVGSALAGVGTLGGENSPTHGGPATSSPFNRPQQDLSGRLPVQVVLPEPPRPKVKGRRPLIAVLDTGYAPHPWLPMAERKPGTATPGTPTPGRALPGTALPDEFIVVDPELQRLIYRVGVDEKTKGVVPSVPIDGHLDGPAIGNPLTGEIDSHFGHGVFIAGLIRQLVPDAQVLMVRVMHPDGCAYEGTVAAAFAWLQDQVDRGLLTIDAVSFSAGCFPETPDEFVRMSAILAPIRGLLEAGVPVVAAAGNYATSRRFFPAALAAEQRPASWAPMVAVGALNPDASVSHFSNQAAWVTCYDSGAALVSTFPVTTDGGVQPTLRVDSFPRRRATIDLDGFTSGWALWSGTSFATPVVAAQLVDAMSAVGGCAGGERAVRALEDLKEQSQRDDQR